MENLQKLVKLNICDSPVLEELPFPEYQHCLECITIDGCVKLNKLDLQVLYNLKTISGISDLANLETLVICDCPKLEKLSGLARLSCLERIDISGCNKLQDIALPTKLEWLYISACRELEELSLTGLSCMERIKIDSCEKLRRLDVIEELHALKYSLKTVSGMSDLANLRTLEICKCPKLEELSSLTRLSCLERIDISCCNKLQNIALPAKLEWLNISACPELEQLSLTGLSCLNWIKIDTCEKLKKIDGIEELHALKYMKLRYFNNAAAVVNCIHRLQSVPSKCMRVVGRAVDGAESTLNRRLFCDADSVIDIDKCYVGEFAEYCLQMHSQLGTVIVCAVVEDKVLGREMIVTIVAADHHNWNSWDFIYDFGLCSKVKKGYAFGSSSKMKKGYEVLVKKGEEWKILQILHTICDSLYEK